MRGLSLSTTLIFLLGTAPSICLGQSRIDLGTKEGVEKVKGQWKFTNVKIIEVDGKAPDGTPNRTYNIDPPSKDVTKPDYDTSTWENVDPTTLGQRRSTGLVCFCWYQIKITLPDEVAGKKVHFVTTVDDYGEVWVDDKLPRRPGQSGGSVVAGFNTPNRVELPDAAPGKSYLISIFGMNGPISAAPGNWIFLGPTFLEISEP